MATVADMRAEREQLLTRAREIVDGASGEGRDLTDGENVEYEQAVERASELGPLITREEKMDVLRRAAASPSNREAGTPFGATAGVAGMTGSRGPELVIRRDGSPWDDAIRSEIITGQTGRLPRGGDMLRSAALRAIDLVDVPDAGRERAAALVEADDPGSDIAAAWVLASSDPYYRSAFRKWMRNPVTGHLTWNTDEQAAYARADTVRASLQLGNTGSNLVPFQLDPTILITNAGVLDPIRGLATIKTIATNEWHGVTSAGVTAAWVAESTAASDNTPTTAQPGIPAHKAMAWVKGSVEFLSDSDFATQLPRLLADAKARLEGAAFATGSGSGQPTGMVTAAVAVTTSRIPSAGASMAVADIFSVSNDIAPRYAGNASWLANKSVFNQIRQFSTNSSGGAFWTDMGTGIPSQLLGDNVYRVSSMDKMASGTTSTLLLAGDVSQYYIVDRIGMSIMFNGVVHDTTSSAPTGESEWVTYWRVGGDLVDPGAVRVYRQFTTTSDWV